MYLHEIFQTAEPGDTVRRAVWAPHVFGTADICATDWSIGGPEVEVAGNFRDAAALLMFGSTAVPLAVDPGGIGGYLAIPAYVPLPQPEGAE